jgi:hypothetical protein
MDETTLFAFHFQLLSFHILKHFLKKKKQTALEGISVNLFLVLKDSSSDSTASNSF